VRTPLLMDWRASVVPASPCAASPLAAPAPRKEAPEQSRRREQRGVEAALATTLPDLGDANPHLGRPLGVDQLTLTSCVTISF
jgi:hypothetical protein